MVCFVSVCLNCTVLSDKQLLISCLLKMGGMAGAVCFLFSGLGAFCASELL